MENLDYLIPESILEQMQLSKFNFDLELTSTSCNNRWPMVRVSIGNEVVFDNVVVNHQHIVYSTDTTANELNVQIEYYNKQDDDTTVSEDGRILENQSVTILSLRVNSIDLIKTQIIYNLGYFYQNLSPNKQKYFIEHGFSIEPSHTLHLGENGIWKLMFKFPIVYHFVKYKAFQAPYESWPDIKLLSEMYNLVQEIRILEQQNHS